ncbi:DUF5131 family protein [Petralouisia muris]|uniref:DUF5131 family protein n=1 Tax=Petralouisia muris TaxID=3032872 RepID=A0AC61RQ05_9FIRM|nr:DUF5131 family protein [Petralouisia muris]TGY90878.1 DUF5131 family protein [Petralouisia muris]
MNRSKIEWCDHTWNPVTGCWHGCPYCYAQKMAVRFSGDVRLNLMAKEDYAIVTAADGTGRLYELDAPMMNETGSVLVYPFEFEPTYHRYRMDMPDKLKMGNNIFVGAMADIFGEWVPDRWIEEIFNACRKRPIHNYLFLTKNPGRYERIEAMGRLPADKNMWYGSTLTRPENKRFMSNRHNTFLSIEPIHAPFRIWKRDEFSPNWIIIGAETGRRREKIIPQKEWIEDIVEWCENSGIPVFMKDSLVSVVGENGMRREFPEQLRHSEISPKMEKRLFDVCSECRSKMKKSDMIVLLARSRRGEQPKQFGFMCKSCFRKFCQNSGLDVPKLAELTKNIMIEAGDGNGKVEPK